MFYDSTYILVVIGAIISMIAQARVKSTFSKYSRMGSASGLTGAAAAQKILTDAGITDVEIRHIAGNLTDNYNPGQQTLNLSDSTIYSNSVAAIGVAAHECGHAIQHHRGYAPLHMRSLLYPAASFGQNIAWPVILVGLMMNSRMSLLLLNVGIILFSLGVLFQLITLPVEFNASSRAVRILRNSGMMSEQELHAVKQVLTAAALTYVASACASILSLLRIVLLSGRKRR